jgi:hypothetical protein
MSSIEVLEERINGHERQQDRRWESIERWLGQIDGRMAAIEGRRMHPAITFTLVVCALALASSMITVAINSTYLVKLAIEQHAIDMKRDDR